MQEKRWKLLIKPGITAIVGAGGKSTVLQKLAEYSKLQGTPTMITTTTEMYAKQMEKWNPYIGEDFNEAIRHCEKRILEQGQASWISGMDREKAIGLLPEYIDDIHRVYPHWQILVEADGAREKWLKAPKEREPVIPWFTNMTIGVINLQVLGKPISATHIHNVDLLESLLERPEGAIITSSMLAKLVTHSRGLFQYSRGERVVFCTGYDTVSHRTIDAFLDALQGKYIDKIILADGYQESCEIRQILTWA